MPICIRRIIFAFFVIIFIISASAILFYGSGYRWNGTRNKIEKTGQLSLDSKPKGANVYVNGEPLRGIWEKLTGAPIETTPTVMKNLLPGDVNVELKKEGYYSWKKNARVISGQTAVFHGIRLIKNEAPQKIISGDVLQFSIISDTLIVALTQQDFFLYDMKSGNVVSLFHSDIIPFVSFDSRQDGEQFFVRTKEKEWIVNTNSTKIDLSAAPRIVREVVSVRWSENNELFGKTKDDIIHISLKPLAFESILNVSVDDFFVRGGKLFTIEGKEKKVVRMRDLKRKESSSIDVLPLPSGGSFLDEPSHDIVIQKSNGGITILSPLLIGNTFNILELENIRELSPKKDNVFFGWNDIELWQYTLSGREYGKTLLTRQSMPLQQVVFSHIVPAVFFLSNNSVTMIDMADANGNQMQLTSWDQLQNMNISRDEKELYLLGVFNGVQGLYKIQIVD